MCLNWYAELSRKIIVLLKVYLTDIFLFAWSNLRWILIWMGKKQIRNLFLFTVFLPSKRVKNSLPVGSKPHWVGAGASRAVTSKAKALKNSHNKQTNWTEKFTKENHGLAAGKPEKSKKLQMCDLNCTNILYRWNWKWARHLKEHP